jgi:hypothetical protein
MDFKTGHQQQEYQNRLQPMPEALITAVQINIDLLFISIHATLSFGWQ